MKKIRVTVPEDIWRLMKNDIEEFGINNNKLCNYILDKLKYKREINTERELEAQGRPVKKIIQFDLNVSNKEIYYDILRENKVEVEAEFFRDLFETYCSKFTYQRELFVFEEKLKKVMNAIKDKKKLKVKYLDHVVNVDPYFIKREEQGDENYLFCYYEKEGTYHNYKLKELEVIGILEEKIKGKDKKFVDQVRKNFDPFLGNGNFVKVKFTKLGEVLYKSLFNYRPKLIKKDGDVYIFETSNENAKLYFRQFLKEAVVIEPRELKDEIKAEFLEAYESY